jgi:hypothetical protein
MDFYYKIRMTKSRRIRWERHVACIGEKLNAYRVLVGKLEAERPLERHGRSWEDIMISVREIGWGGMDWIHLAQDRDQ